MFYYYSIIYLLQNIFIFRFFNKYLFSQVVNRWIDEIWSNNPNNYFEKYDSVITNHYSIYIWSLIHRYIQRHIIWNYVDTFLMNECNRWSDQILFYEFIWLYFNQIHGLCRKFERQVSITYKIIHSVMIMKIEN